REGADRLDRLLAHARGDELGEATLAVRDAERGVAGMRERASSVDEPLQHRVDRPLGRGREHGLAELAKCRVGHLNEHTDGSSAPHAYGRCGTGGAGWNASFTTRSTFSRRPSTTGCRPPSSRRASWTRPAERSVRKPKSARKSLGKIVRWTRKRS